MKDYYCCSRPEIFRLVPPNVRRVLEIGCAAGRFRLNFSDQVEYWGVESVDKVAALAAQNGIRVVTGDILDVADELPDNYFDLVVCNDVIEHVVDTEALMAVVRGKLRNGGVVIGSIPNVRNWRNLMNLILRRDWKYEPYGVLDRTHVRFFTRRSFRRMLAENGFAPVEMWGICTWRMRLLQVLFSPLLVIFGFDQSYLQLAFRTWVKR